MRKLLCDRLYEVCAASKLAPEHLEIAGLVKEARRYVVEEGPASAVREELDQRCWTIESNVDLIEWSADPVWIEWHLPSRAVERQGLKARTGCLISPHPEHEELIAVVTAWEDPETDSVHHSYSTALIDLERLHEHAHMARKYSKVSDDSFERLISLIGITLSDGFRDELVLRHKGNVGIIERTMRLGTAEIPFLLALLVTRQAQGGLMVDWGQTDTHGSFVLSPSPEKTFFERIEDKLWNAPQTGIFRRVKSRKALLKWYRAA